MTLRLIARPSGILVPRKDFGLQGAPSGDLIFGEDIGYVASLLLGHDGNEPRMLKSTSGGLLLTDTGLANPYTTDTQFFAGRQDFSSLFDDFGPNSTLNGVSLGMSGAFNPNSFGFVAGLPVWQATFGNGAEFQTRNLVNGMALFGTRVMLPAQATIPAGGSVVFGIKESGSSSPGAAFRFVLTPTAFQVQYTAGGDNASGVTIVDITGSLPGLYSTALIFYYIVVSEDAVRFFANNILVLTLPLALMQTHGAGQWRASWAHNGAGLMTSQIYYLTLTAALPDRAIRVNFPSVSAANTAQQIVMDLAAAQSLLDIISVGSGGTHTLQVEVSTDAANWTSIDTLAAALTQAKHYLNSTVGGTVAVSPLAFRFVRLTAGAAGAGFTTTLTVSAK